MITAENAVAITKALGSGGAILLRGRESILKGEKQNDIDLYLPAPDKEVESILGRFEIARAGSRTPWQRKVFIRVPATEETAELDLFSELTWRGIRMLDPDLLPKATCNHLGITYLDDDAAIWLTVVKNGLHRSPTEARKLVGCGGNPSWPLALGTPGPLGHRIDQWLAVNVWTIARRGTVSWSSVFKIRLAFLTLRMIEAPIKTLKRYAIWAAHKIRQKVRI